MNLGRHSCSNLRIVPPLNSEIEIILLTKIKYYRRSLGLDFKWDRSTSMGITCRGRPGLVEIHCSTLDIELMFERILRSRILNLDGVYIFKAHLVRHWCVIIGRTEN
eukprot:NODE_106_length_19060_cov_0.700227.p19 type:complete len:107 gc:universal NODE_106_length_19060_cov_0.700227:14047-14367(+)